MSAGLLVEGGRWRVEPPMAEARVVAPCDAERDDGSDYQYERDAYYGSLLMSGLLVGLGLGAFLDAQRRRHRCCRGAYKL